MAHSIPQKTLMISSCQGTSQGFEKSEFVIHFRLTGETATSTRQIGDDWNF
ncbi:hypothetical protein Plim_3409 [Planctopirus limnophila DSM 3776]|uniref:Uncharacterized protein n=1 Tax=Planctopirus limnophila (strain ATCC 43296 / DSM 3776 / IFAM 1008 / Mu 290) TaxID=521674 RepID=D5SUG9_PLAL2|nr:hypothetical protein Plim_3409 [Planctopirus limnophila DSM 3776]